METLRLLIGTVELRPYVFIFFAIYLFIAVTTIGWKRTAIYTLLAYIVAFCCEYSSSHFDSGIPFGVYKYEQTTRGRELWIAGVPFMDSLSFTFLSFISYRLALFLLSPLRVIRGNVQVVREEARGLPLETAALAGVLMMYLDIIIDPVALQGKRWFLGEIYNYPKPGPYFGVTLANFAGWFVVCFVIVVIFLLIDRGMSKTGAGPTPSRVPAKGMLDYRFKELAPAGLYFGILGFNLWVTFTIGEEMMGLAGLFITFPLLLLVLLTMWRARANT